MDLFQEEDINLLNDEKELIRVFNVIERLREVADFKEKHYICSPMLRLAIRMVETSDEVGKIPACIINIFKEKLHSKELESDECKRLAVREFVLKCLEVAVNDRRLVPYVIVVIDHYVTL